MIEEQKRLIQRLLGQSTHFDLDLKRETRNFEDVVPFEGIPRKHSHNESILVLLTEPLEDHESFYEFTADAIAGLEEMGSITSEKEGYTYMKVRVWVKKGYPAVRSETFIVE